MATTVSATDGSPVELQDVDGPSVEKSDDADVVEEVEEVERTQGDHINMFMLSALKKHMDADTFEFKLPEQHEDEDDWENADEGKEEVKVEETSAETEEQNPEKEGADGEEEVEEVERTQGDHINRFMLSALKMHMDGDTFEFKLPEQHPDDYVCGGDDDVDGTAAADEGKTIETDVQPVEGEKDGAKQEETETK
eukprot:TRINITY_DN6478_c0_g1_i1.p1 TRINITY_DN6478_c0_g1~~TRINITY_DN6478_c0_g1_i1.p1  ORF type:complete len:195 (-),score=76.54 TRINITY_DN6478_c0_g1_i1:231-815(-)